MVKGRAHWSQKGAQENATVKPSINVAIFTEMHHYTYHEQPLISQWNLSNLRMPSTSLCVS